MADKGWRRFGVRFGRLSRLRLVSGFKLQFRSMKFERRDVIAFVAGVLRGAQTWRLD